MKDDKVSLTAFNVAQGILYTAQRKKVKSLVSEEENLFYRDILNATETGRSKLKQLNNPVFKRLIPLIEKLMIPGLTVHYVLRKKAIEDFVRSSLEKGVRQVVNLGAGFDSLGYRLALEFKSVSFIEVDHPATHSVKKEALEKMGGRPENLSLLDVDFNRDSLEQKIKSEPAFNKTKPAVFVIEGVLMYLDETKINELLVSLKKICPKGFRLVFTFITPEKEGKHTHGPLLALYLKMTNEPLNWQINQNDLKSFMAKNEINLVSVVKSEEILRRRLPEAGNIIVHDGEQIACADYQPKGK